MKSTTYGNPLYRASRLSYNGSMETKPLTVNHPTFSPEFQLWLATADLEDIYSEYSDAYKEVHNIRPRWAHGMSRDYYAEGFISIGEHWKFQEELESEWAEHERWAALNINQPIPAPKWIPADKYEAMAGEPL